MSDRELLEKAARAAGINWEMYEPPSDDQCYPFHPPLWGLWMAPGWWNPLENDGDAFRLMVELGMEVKCYSNVIVVTTPDGLDEEELTGEELCKPDELGATRRAIVRAAAAMADQ